MLVDTTVVSEYDDFSPTCENYLFIFCSLASRLMKTSKKKKVTLQLLSRKNYMQLKL